MNVSQPEISPLCRNQTFTTVSTRRKTALLLDSEFGFNEPRCPNVEIIRVCGRVMFLCGFHTVSDHQGRSASSGGVDQEGGGSSEGT